LVDKMGFGKKATRALGNAYGLTELAS
jgi:hypothetical protein